jgi:hypothetical protein
MSGPPAPLRLGTVIRVWLPDICRVPDSTGTGMRTIFYPLVTPVPDPNRDGYETGIFFPSVDTKMGTRYFTTAIILCCEQV